MVFCSNCKEEVEADIDDANGYSCCTQCGNVLDEAAFASDVTFTKGPGGESAVDGQRVSEGGVARGMGRIAGGRQYGHQYDSHEKSLARGRAEIGLLISQLNIRPRDEVAEASHRFYRLALQHNFTRGRRTNQVAAACIYIYCRQDNQPFMLIDFSDALQVNVFVLGSVFLQLAQLLRLHELPTYRKPVDPSLYIHRFAGKLGLGSTADAVSATSLQLIKSMKRDWMQTGRRPAGICGAALFVALHIHGFQRTKAEVVRVVHVGVSTIATRLREFTGTDSSALTYAQLKEVGKHIDGEHRHLLQAPPLQAMPSQTLALTMGDPVAVGGEGEEENEDGEQEPLPPSARLGCEHIVNEHIPPFAHGLCRECYLQYLERSGGVHGGANPPAFASNRKKDKVARLQAELDTLQTRLQELADGGELPGDDAEVATDMALALATGELAPMAQALPEAEQQRLGDGARAASGAGLAAPNSGGNGAAPAASNGGGSNGARPVAAGGVAPGRRRFRPSAAALAAGAAAAGTQLPSVLPGSDAEAVPPPARRRRLNGDPAPDADAATTGAAAADRAGSAGAGPSLAGRGAADAEATGGEEDPTNLQLALVPAGRGEGVGEDSEEAEPEKETFSDLDDDELDGFVLSTEEVELKEQVWTALNADYLERQAAKEAATCVADKKQADREASRAQAEAAAGAAVDAGAPDAQQRQLAAQRRRGRPSGSKTRSRPEDATEPADSPEEAARRMIEKRKLSTKINYNVLADLFSDDPAPGAGDQEDEEAAPDGSGGGPSSGPGAVAGRPASPAGTPSRQGAQRQRLSTLLDDLPTTGSRARAPSRLGGARNFAPRLGARPRR